MLAKASGLKVDPVENTRLVKEAVEQVKDADRIIAVMGEPNNWSERLAAVRILVCRRARKSC